MKYLHLFDTVAEYNEARSSSYEEPWVSLTEANDEVKYNKTEREKLPETPLTFEILSDGMINWMFMDMGEETKKKKKTIKYKKNDGEWTSITSTTGGTQINVTSGDTVQFKGDNLAYANMDNGGGWINLFSGTTAEFNVKGNIMSLIDSDDFETLDTLTCAATFTGLFGSCTGLTSAENLILPATTLVVSCYQSMFAGCTNLTTAPALPATTLAMACYTGMLAICTSLTTAPALPATTLADGCYVSMFEGCTNLNYIKAMFTTTPSTTYTQNWVDGVSSTGTFVKNSAAQWDVTGADGIPSGWTVETA